MEVLEPGDHYGTRQGAEGLCEQLLQHTRRRIESEGRVPAAIFLVATRDPATGRQLDQPQLISVEPPSMAQGARRTYSEMGKRLAAEHGAIGVVLVVEGWGFNKCDPHDVEALRAMLRAGYPAEAWPHRQEIVLVSCAHLAFGNQERSWSAGVSHNGDRTYLEPYQEMSPNMDWELAGQLRSWLVPQPQYEKIDPSTLN